MNFSFFFFKFFFSLSFIFSLTLLLFALPYFVGCVAAFSKICKVLEPFFYLAFFSAITFLKHIRPNVRVVFWAAVLFWRYFMNLFKSRCFAKFISFKSSSLLSTTEVQFFYLFVW